MFYQHLTSPFFASGNKIALNMLKANKPQIDAINKTMPNNSNVSLRDIEDNHKKNVEMNATNTDNVVFSFKAK